ncbi:MAG: hypothetical protein HKN21_14365, partial [Candidatus Eisenbacteria bacterium]|nr:hypothetical protein [Candidatus Eisenbacteria bacterium]
MVFRALKSTSTLRPLLLSALLCTLAVSTSLANTVVREVTVDRSTLSVVETSEGTYFKLLGATTALNEGEPDLPILPVMLRLPENQTAKTVRVIPIATETLKDTYRPMTVGAQVPGPAMPMKPSITQSASWFPKDLVITHHTGRMRGNILAGVGVSPVQWNPATGEARLVTKFRVEVETEFAAAHPRDLRIERESRTGRATFERSLNQLTGQSLNGQGGILGSSNYYTPLINSGEPFHPTFRPSVDGSPVDMVIITDAAQESEYQRIADHKNAVGISTVVRTISWIKSNYPQGSDTQQTIRFFIRDAVSKWGTSFVLLGGDTEIIPVRLGKTLFYGSENIPTDLYYTDLDREWDGDGDGTFGEGYAQAAVPGDSVDLYPDVWVGRLPTSDIAEAQVMVDKTLDYEISPPLGYQTEYLMLGEVLFPQDWSPTQTILFDGADICEDVVTYLQPQLNLTKLYENYTAFPGAIPETKPTVLAEIDAGYNIVHHVGHGYINTMAVGINGETMINSDADNLTNADETFLLYAINCTSSAIDFNCIAERFMLNAVGGSWGVIGSTRLDFPTTGRSYQNEFYDLLLQQNVGTLGEAMTEAKSPFVVFAQNDNTHRWTQFTQIYLGDPSIEFFTDVPGNMIVNHNPTFTLGDGTFDVNVTYDGLNAQNARVTLFKDGDAYSVGFTDALGQASLPFRPDETGTFTVGVKYPNSIPYIGNASVVAPGAAPYMYALSQGIDDDTSGPSNGNNDGLIDAGETIELNVTIKNNGAITETGISALLSTTDPNLSITDNLSFYPDVNAGASSAASDPFVLTITRSTPNRYEAKCTLDVFGANGSYSQEIVLYIHAPSFSYYQQALRDTVGNGNSNGTIETNEDFAIIAYVCNEGLGDARSVELRLRSGDPAVTITDSVTVIGDIPAGTIGSNPADAFQLSLSNLTDYHELELVVVDAYGEVYSHLLDWVIPGPVADLTTFGSSSAISLTWTAVEDTVLWGYNHVQGYNIYRSSFETGPFSKINPKPTKRIAYYSDEGLPPLTRYYYQIAAIDSSGNEGGLSPVGSATTSLPIHAGWPVEVQTATTAGITLADLNDDGIPEVVSAGEEIYAIFENGDEVTNGDSDVRTLGPISGTGAQG